MFGEGIDLLKNKEGEISVDKKGHQAYKFPATVADDNDENNGMDCSQIIPCIDFGEQRVADILASVGLFAKFAEKFPGEDISMFDAAVMGAIKTKLPGLFMKVRLETNKSDFQNVVEFAKADAKVENKAKGAAKGGKAKAGAATAAAAKGGDDW
jgi:hypothetical protein